MMSGDEWLDFKVIKNSADARKILSHFGLLEYLEDRGAELVGWCPFGEEHGKKDSFSVNIEKKAFQCFACKARGSLLDLVAKLQNGNLREAAHTVIAIMGGGEAVEKKSGGRPYRKGKEESATREVVSETSGPASTPMELGCDADEEIPPVMSFSLASRLIIANAIHPAHLLVVNMDAVGIEWKKAKKE